jgi:isochorismate pyruvate lyase
MKVQRVFSGTSWEKSVGYCRAIWIGNSIAVSGTVAVDEEGKPFAPGDAYLQAKKSLEIIEKALISFGLSRKDVIRTRMFVTDISKWEDFGRAHGEFFADHPPATSMLEVKALIHPDFLIEIEADALCPEA